MAEGLQQRDRTFSFAELLAPVSQDVFFREHLDKRYLHIPGSADKFPGLMNWDVLTRLLNMSAVWSSQNFFLQKDRKTIPHHAFCVPSLGRNGGTEMRPLGSKVMEFMRDGASMVLNDIDMLTPDLTVLADAIEHALSAKVQMNLYCSGDSRQAFNAHFDMHDVFAVHVEGEKVWRIYETVLPHPIRHDIFESLGEDYHKQHRGKIVEEVLMRPGDVLYLPRGQYHDAVATGGGTVHIAVGVTHFIGLDVVSMLWESAARDEVFRRNLPRHAAGEEAMRKHLSRLGKRLQEIANQPGFLRTVRNAQKQYFWPRGGVELPVETAVPRYYLTRGDYSLSQDNEGWIFSNPEGGARLPPGEEPMVRWILEKIEFSKREFLDAFGAVPVEQLERLLGDLLRSSALAVDDR